MSFVQRKSCSGCKEKIHCSQHQDIKGHKWSSCEGCKKCGSAPCTVCTIGRTCPCCGKNPSLESLAHRKAERAIALERRELEIQSQYRLMSQSCNECKIGYCRVHTTLKYTDY